MTKHAFTKSKHIEENEENTIQISPRFEEPLPGFYYDSTADESEIKRININHVSCQSEQDRFLLEQFRASYRLDSFFFPPLFNFSSPSS